MPRARKGTLEEQACRDYFTKLRSFLRRVSTKWPEKIKAKCLARRPYIGENKRQQWEYQCNICKQWGKWGTKKAKGMVVDHIKPCGTFLCSEDFKTFIPKLFCVASGLQVLCYNCHINIKTKDDREKGWK